jgi:hypothetical protein
MAADFSDQQRRYYMNELNRALPSNSRVADASTIQAALGFSDGRGVADTVRYVDEFGLAGTDAIKRDSECRATPFPTSGMRQPDARTGCGWWYVPNPATPSVGAYGTRRGPMSPTLDTQVGSGQWIWDPAQAQSMEAAKQAAQIRSCPDIQYAKMPNMGWCTVSNSALLTDGNGNPAYPRSPGGDCPQGSIVTNAANCPPPPPGPGPSGPPGPTSLCSPGAGGALSPGCLQSLVTQSCSSNGLLAQSLTGGTYPSASSQFNSVYAVAQRSGLQLNPGLVNNGQLGVGDVQSSVAALARQANSGDGTRATNAAQALCYGTPFNPCAYAPTDSGPYDQDCITQSALAQGYSPQGSALAAGNMSFWNSLGQWQSVLSNLTSMKQQADNPQTDPNLQATRIGQVYGLGVKYPRQGCNYNGVMVNRYLYPTGFPQFGYYGPNTHFLGRYLFKNGFPSSSVPAQVNQEVPGGYIVTEGQHFATSFVPAQGGSYQFMLNTTNNTMLFVNGQQMFSGSWITGTATSQPTQMVADQSYTLDLWTFNPGGVNWSFDLQVSVNGGGWQELPAAQLFLVADRRQPMIELAFNKMATVTSPPQGGAPIADTNNVFQNLVTTANIGPLNGKQALIVGGSGQGVYNYSKWVQGVRLRAIKTITMMLQINSVTPAPQGTVPSIVSFFNLPQSVTYGGLPRAGFDPSFVQPYASRTNDFMITAEATGLIFPWGVGPAAGTTNIKNNFSQNVWTSDLGVASYTPGQWFHFAFVWDDDFTGYTIYVNGQQAGRAMIPAYDPTLIMEQMRIGCDAHPEGQAWTGGIAWFRAFDYRLSTDLLQTDMNDAWSSLV